MEITYYLTEKDIIVARRFARKTSPLLKRMNNIGMFTLALIPCIFFLLSGQFTASRIVLMLIEILITLLLFFTLSKIFYPLMDKYSLRLLKKKNNGVLGEHTIQLTEEKMIESSSINESHHKWAAIDRVDENDDYIFINSVLIIYIIPKRDFASIDDATQFYKQARIYHEKF